jgi:hypothetical protein
MNRSKRSKLAEAASWRQSQEENKQSYIARKFDSERPSPCHHQFHRTHLYAKHVPKMLLQLLTKILLQNSECKISGKRHGILIRSNWFSLIKKQKQTLLISSATFCLSRISILPALPCKIGHKMCTNLCVTATTVTFIKKTQRGFWEAFFQRIILDSLKPIKTNFWHFLTDKGPNIVSQYDFWTIAIFTSLKLALKIIIFRICQKFWA